MTKDNHKLGHFDLNGIPPAPRGQPQIEVTFEIDANGILNVQAVEKGTGKSEKITITNDKGRLSQEEIDRMVKEAEDFAEQDKNVKAKIDARNALESFCYSTKQQVSDKLGEKLASDDKSKVETAIEEALEWLDANSDAEKEEYEEKLKEVQDAVQPILAKVMADAGAAADDEDLGGHDEL
jgi:heat shock protein 5